jgi:hypothetical protein
VRQIRRDPGRADNIVTGQFSDGRTELQQHAQGLSNASAGPEDGDLLAGGRRAGVGHFGKERLADGASQGSGGREHANKREREAEMVSRRKALLVSCYRVVIVLLS